mmetsp:Transcript_8297/g.10496  ORF Transcript_8297/g.10496 Transcript_8297/m.10496 type:complete len:456 (-) Transcript_8297:218-1585(-)
MTCVLSLTLCDWCNGGHRGGADLVYEKTISTAYDRAYPRPIMLQDNDLNIACKKYNGTWRFCPKINEARKVVFGLEDPHLYYQCDARQFIAAVKCGFVDIGKLGKDKGSTSKIKTAVKFPGLVFDDRATYPVHGVVTDIEAKRGAQPIESKPAQTLKLPVLAHHLGVYPESTGHFFNQLPRLFLLLYVLPPSIPIVVKKHKLMVQLIQLLHRLGVVGNDRFVAAEPKTLEGKLVLFTGEMGRLPGQEKWYNLPVERCSFGMAMARQLMRELLVKPMGMDQTHKHLEVLVVDRRDAGPNQARALRNHCDVMQKLRAKLPGAKVREYVGTQLSFEEQIKAFMRADLLIAPHGAAIGLCGFMRPGGAVLEVAYPMRVWPAIFMPVALSAKLRYYLSFGKKGKHSGPIQANVNEIGDLAVKAAKAIGKFGVPPSSESESSLNGKSSFLELKSKCFKSDN